MAFIVLWLTILSSYLLQALLSSDSNGVASTSISRCSVYVTDENTITGLVFPVDPVVVSLKDYDSAETAGQPINGYPLICITVSFLVIYY